jgi:RNA polymerase sigma-70 factor, ECF subfamily
MAKKFFLIRWLQDRSPARQRRAAAAVISPCRGRESPIVREEEVDRSVTLDAAMPGGGRDDARRVATVDRERALDRFLAGVERRAFRIACLALGDRGEAEDAVQDAMIRLVRRYGRHPEEQWRPLFYRILRNRITDAQRSQKVRRAVMAWWSPPESADTTTDLLDTIADVRGQPDGELEGEELIARIERALVALSARQREAFLLRNFEGLDVAQAAVAMGCSEGSVKTHYFRALQALQTALAEWKS